MKILKNRSGYYEARFKAQDGKVHSLSTHRKNKDEAREVLSKAKIAELELAAEIGILSPVVASIISCGTNMTVEDAIEPWLEWRQMKHHSPHTIADAEIWVRAWATSIGILSKSLKAINETHLDRWVNSTTSKSKLNTRAVMLSALRSFFTFCSAKGWTTGDPSALVSVDQFLLMHEQKEVRKQPIFTDDEVNSLLRLTSDNGRRPNDFWHAAVAIGRWTGLRLSDIASLEWSCFSVTGKICVWTQKRDRRVELPLEPSELTEAILKVPRMDPCFIFPIQRALVRDPTLRSKLSRQFCNLCELCGIVGKSFHALRATYITDCLNKGIPIEHIAVKVGHSNPQTTLGYCRPIPTTSA